MDSYAQAIRNRIDFDWGNVPPLVVNPMDIPTEVQMKGLSVDVEGKLTMSGPGDFSTADMKARRSRHRMQELVFDTASHLTRLYSVAGGRPFVFFSRKHSLNNDTTLARRRGVTGVAFAGARPFPFLEGSGFSFLYDQGSDSTVRARGAAFQLIGGLQVEPAPDVQTGGAESSGDSTGECARIAKQAISNLKFQISDGSRGEAEVSSKATPLPDRAPVLGAGGTGRTQGRGTQNQPRLPSRPTIQLQWLRDPPRKREIPRQAAGLGMTPF